MLGSWDQEVYDLKEEIRNLEETVPVTFSNICKKCKILIGAEKDLKKHDNKYHQHQSVVNVNMIVRMKMM